MRRWVSIAFVAMLLAGCLGAVAVVWDRTGAKFWALVLISASGWAVGWLVTVVAAVVVEKWSARALGRSPDPNPFTGLTAHILWLVALWPWDLTFRIIQLDLLRKMALAKRRRLG